MGIQIFHVILQQEKYNWPKSNKVYWYSMEKYIYGKYIFNASLIEHLYNRF